MVADSPELAQARERIAALEADASGLRARVMQERTERDAALARVAELTHQLAAAAERGDTYRARVAELEALFRRCIRYNVAPGTDPTAD